MKNILLNTSTFSFNDFPNDYCFVPNAYKRKLTAEENAARIRSYQPVGIVAGVEVYDRHVLDIAKQAGVKVISRCGVGTDALDLEYAKAIGIKVVTTPQAPMVAVAELAIALMLSLLRNITAANQAVKTAHWSKPAGRLLSGKTVGIIGCGRIGSYVARILEAFDAKCIGHDPYIQQHPVCEMTSLEEVLAQSDIITLHMPLNESTANMIGSEQISRMKPGALLINTARGGLVDEQALIEGLRNGYLAGAGIDVYTHEPYDGELCGIDSVVLTPHIGSSAKEARMNMEREALENLMNELAD